MKNWCEFVPSLVQRVGEFAALVPETMEGMDRMAQVPTRHLDARTHELIALAVAATTRSDGCIGVHVQEAIKAGASREEIAEALAVAISMNAGVALVYSAKVLDAYAAFDKQ